MQILFWILSALLFYTYVGYLLLLTVVNAIFPRRKVVAGGSFPDVTFVVPAYNEEDVIRQKIENTLALDYPPEKLSFLFVTDGSTDATPAIVAEYPQVALLHEAVRRGKAAAVNRAALAVQTPVVVFSDANTMVHPQSVQKLVRHFANARVGGVSGEKRVAAKNGSAVSFGEGLYWQYESLLKKANGDFYTLVGAAGELFCLRTALFRPLPPSVVLDDFVLSASVCLQGYRFLYEAEAFAVESSSVSLAEERKRKVRISAGCYQALFLLPSLLNFFRHFRLSFQYLSHRVLRWVICPLALPLLLGVNVYLAAKPAGAVYGFLLGAQGVFYLVAAAGWRFRTGERATPLLVPGYFVFMVLSQYRGFYRFVRGRQPAVWEKAQRQSTGKI